MTNTKTNTNGATTNNTQKGKVNTMKDYTLGGRIECTTWQEFIRFCKEEYDINTGHKSFEVLSRELQYYLDQDDYAEAEYSGHEDDTIIVPAGDIGSDKYYPELQKEKKGITITIDRKHGDFIVKAIVKASFIASKGDSKGKRIITMHKLFGIIKRAYTTNNEQLEESFIKDIVNQLVTLKYLCFKKYESDAMIFYPTVRASEYVKNNK